MAIPAVEKQEKALRANVLCSDMHVWCRRSRLRYVYDITMKIFMPTTNVSGIPSHNRRVSAVLVAAPGDQIRRRCNHKQRKLSTSSPSHSISYWGINSPAISLSEVVAHAHHTLIFSFTFRQNINLLLPLVLKTSKKLNWVQFPHRGGWSTERSGCLFGWLLRIDEGRQVIVLNL